MTAIVCSSNTRSAGSAGACLAYGVAREGALASQWVCRGYQPNFSKSFPAEDLGQAPGN